MRFTDEINRLFDQLVHEPWATPRTPRADSRLGREAQLEFEIPVRPRDRNWSVSLQGRELLIRTSGSPARAGAEPATGEPSLERSFILPESTEVSAIEARIQDGFLRIRVLLRTVG